MAETVSHFTAVKSSAENVKDFFHCSHLDHILRLDEGLIREHYPIRIDLSKFKSWVDLREGLFFMIKGEILGQYPVAQHLKVGTIFNCTWSTNFQAIKSGPFRDVTLQKSVVPGSPGATDIVSRYFKKSNPF